MSRCRYRVRHCGFHGAGGTVVVSSQMRVSMQGCDPAAVRVGVLGVERRVEAHLHRRRRRDGRRQRGGRRRRRGQRRWAGRRGARWRCGSSRRAPWHARCWSAAAVADARCRLTHPMMSIVLMTPRMIMETSSSMSVSPAWPRRPRLTSAQHGRRPQSPPGYVSNLSHQLVHMRNGGAVQHVAGLVAVDT